MAPTSPTPGELYAAVRARIGAVLTDAGPDVDERLVPACPEWNVAQLTAHLAGTTAALAAGDRPTGDVQAWVDAQIADRAGRGALENWAEWDSVGPAYERLLDENEAGYGSLLFDAIVHDDDLRAAVGRPPARDPDAVTYALGRVLSRADAVARKKGSGTLRLSCGGETRQIGEGEPVTTWEIADAWTAMRVLISRRSAAQLTALGMDESRQRWLDVLPYALPTTDLDTEHGAPDRLPR